jgi:hypothetical protein
MMMMMMMMMMISARTSASFSSIFNIVEYLSKKKGLCIGNITLSDKQYD